MNNAETQTLFWQQLQTNAAVFPLDAIAPHATLSNAQSLLIYQQAYLQRLLEVLQATYPRLAARLGETKFTTLMHRYLQVHPSTSPDVGEVGQSLPQFLQAEGHTADADLALIEWTTSFLVGAPDAPALPLTAWQALPPQAYAITGVSFVPAWRYLDRLHLVFWRPQLEVLRTQLTDAEAQAVQTALQGGSLLDCIGCFAAEPDPIQTAVTALNAWFHDGWVRELRPL